MRRSVLEEVTCGGGIAHQSNAISRADLLSREEYEAIRAPWRRRISMLKALQRIELGERATLLLESRETVLHHIHEVLCLERRFNHGLWRHELEEYARLVPQEREVCATLFLHADNAHWVRGFADAIIAGRPVLGADYAGQRVIAQSVDRHRDGEAPVQYLRFRFEKPLTRHPLVFWVEHEGVRCARRVILPQAIVENDNHH